MLPNGFPEAWRDNYLKFSRAANEGILMEDYQRQPGVHDANQHEDLPEFAAAYKGRIGRAGIVVSCRLSVAR